MATVNRSDAQQRADEIGIFNRELGRLEGEGVLHLTDEQRGNLHGYQERLLNSFLEAFDIDRNRQTRQLSLGMRVASLLGALALAASLFFLFKQFWGDFNTTIQVMILISTSVLTCCLTFALQRFEASGYFCKLAAVVAFTSFVLNVVLLGDIFNIEPSAKAFLPWAVYGLLLAYGCNSRLLLLLGLGCAGVFFASLAGILAGTSWDSFMERPETFLLPGIAVFSLSLLVSQRRYDGFVVVYRIVGLMGLFVPVLCLSYWGRASYLHLPSEMIESAYQIIGFVLAVAVICLGIQRNWSDVLNVGVGFFVVFLFMKMVDWLWDNLPNYLFFLVIGLCAVLVLLVLRRLRNRSGLAFGGLR
jgi:uncharacterized membrane protein